VWFGPGAACTARSPGDLPVAAQPRAGPALGAGAAAHRNAALLAGWYLGTKQGVTAAERGSDVSGAQHVSGDAASPSPARPGRWAAHGRLLPGPRLQGAHSQRPRSAQVRPVIVSGKDAVNAPWLEKPGAPYWTPKISGNH